MRVVIHRWWAVIMGVIVALGMVVSPILTYRYGTSEDVTVELISAPYLGGPKLKYAWSGDLVRSCPITIRRQFVDSNNVIWELTPSAFAALPKDRLGETRYEIEAQTPEGLPAGETAYQVTEIPKCSWMQRLWPVEIPYPPVVFTVTR